MKIIDDGNNTNFRNYERASSFGIAALFIIAGVIILGRNLGFIDHFVYRIFISWQMLLIAIGTFSLIKRQTTGGLILISVGFFFLIPRLVNSGHFVIGTYWPLVFVLIGVVLLLRLGKKDRSHCCGVNRPEQSSAYNSDNGFVTSHNTFGSVRQIVLDPVFKGAYLSNRFGGTVLDLRNTTLEPGETFIDIDCAFGGIEIYVPYNWTVKNQINPMFSGVEDKRYKTNQPTDSSYVLTVKGSLSFGGVEIKS